jgi:hypothetical protein
MKQARYLSAGQAEIRWLVARSVDRKSTPADTGCGRLPSRRCVGRHPGERRARGRSGRSPPMLPKRQVIAPPATSRSSTNWAAHANSRFGECNRRAEVPTGKANPYPPPRRAAAGPRPKVEGPTNLNIQESKSSLPVADARSVPPAAHGKQSSYHPCLASEVQRAAVLCAMVFPYPPTPNPDCGRTSPGQFLRSPGCKRSRQFSNS